MRRKMMSFAEQLAADLAEVRGSFFDLLAASRIERPFAKREESGILAVGGPEWEWAEVDAAALSTHLQAGKRWREWRQRSRLLFLGAPASLAGRIDEPAACIERWIERAAADHSIPETLAVAEGKAKCWFDELEEIVRGMETPGASPLVLMPDTGALIDNPDLASYGLDLDTDAYQVVLAPVVFHELDELKHKSSKEEVRQAAQAVARRFKELRDRGRLTKGVSLTKKIEVRAEAREPNMREMLDWLDPAVPDDRLLASALQVQASNPGSLVALVTNDINLTNKADVAGLPYLSTPLTIEQRSAKLVPRVSHDQVLTVTNEGKAAATDLSYSLRRSRACRGLGVR